ncbi:hypothetical protein PGH07_07865 [Sulfurovum sp. zt1-1]|uniref:Uncharacterized protein n=1 Tax=Sulfurovum zhangzhouensis TaxID=3019067 RepID=A0ABT7QZ44_9BACT|nr:hypothetical protein [Sulfurovum zhangzhouensis]MDM5272093.1 hypothetical protein [Sulfurovum zhangzhouensis]
MVKINVGGNFNSIKDVVKDLDGIRDRDIPYIAITAANNLAFDTKESIDQEITYRLNISKKKLLSPVRITKATKSNLFVKIFIDEWSWQHKVLKHHFFGGDRDRKGLEKAMMEFGHMSRNEILTPSPGVTIKPSTYVKIISQLKLVYKSGYSANETKRSRFRNRSRQNERYFVIPTYKRSHLHPGIYARMPDHDKPICILRISKQPKYKKRLTSFEDTVNKVQSRRSDIHLGEAIDRVMKQNKRMGWIE